MNYFSRKRILREVLVLILCLLSPWYLEAKRMVIKLATLAPEGTSWHELLIDMGQEWQRVTGGDIILRIYPSGVAGDERDMIRKIRIGQIHAAAVTIEGLTEISQDMNVFFIPLLVDSFEDLETIRGELSSHLTSELEMKGFKLLSWADVGWAYWFTSEPIETPSDLKELRIFTWAGDYRWAELWKMAGFQPVPLSSIDVLPSLQTGLIDAFATVPLFALSKQWFAVAPHMLDLRWGSIIGAIIIDKKVWDSIPAEYHPSLLEIARRTEDRAKALLPQAEEAIEVMQENGLKVHHLSQEQKNTWLEFTKSFYPHFRGTIVPEKMFDRAIELQEELESQKK